MLQHARSSNSKSFLRELENALVLIQDEKNKHYFLQKMQEVFLKRNDPTITLTGEKALKSEILAYLKENGYVQTANVWARNVPMDRKELEELLVILQTRLLQNNIQGILELHLQDREINSPHFQFVGLNSQMAESIIAHTLVELDYETSIESALSKKDFIPYFNQNSKARTQDLNTMLEYYEKRAKHSLELDELLKELERISKESRVLLEELKNKRRKLNQQTQSLQERLDAYKMNLDYKNFHYKRLRRRTSFYKDLTSTKAIIVISTIAPPFEYKELFIVNKLPNQYGFLTSIQKKQNISEEQALECELGLSVIASPFTLKDIGGAYALKEYTKQLIKAEKQGYKAKGIFLVGIPGTGKTFFPKCFAGELKRKLIALNLSQIMESDEPIQTLNKVFEFLHKRKLDYPNEKFVILIDEIEKMIGNASPKEKQMLGRLLTILNDINTPACEYSFNAIFFATANDLGSILDNNPEFLSFSSISI